MGRVHIIHHLNLTLGVVNGRGALLPVSLSPTDELLTAIGTLLLLTVLQVTGVHDLFLVVASTIMVALQYLGGVSSNRTATPLFKAKTAAGLGLL